MTDKEDMVDCFLNESLLHNKQLSYGIYFRKIHNCTISKHLDMIYKREVTIHWKKIITESL